MQAWKIVLKIGAIPLSMNNSLTIIVAFLLMWKESCKAFNNFHWEVSGRNNIWSMYIQGPS